MPFTPALTPPVVADDRDVREDLRSLTVAALLGTALVHGRVVPEHLEHWPLAGVFFLVLALAEVLLALLVTVRRSRVVVVAALAVSVLPVAVWTVSRTLGLPFGPEAGLAEPVSWADSVCAVLEVAAAGCALLLVRAGGLLRRCAPASSAWVALGLAAVAVLTAVGVVGAGLPEHAPESPSQHQVGHDDAAGA